MAILLYIATPYSAGSYFRSLLSCDNRFLTRFRSHLGVFKVSLIVELANETQSKFSARR